MMSKQLAEKDEAIKYLKGIKRYDIGEMLNENIKLKQSQNQTAIAELEKVVEFIKEYPHEPRYWDIVSYIYQQIKELKGEK